MIGRATVRKAVPDFVTGVLLILSLNVYSYTIDTQKTLSRLYTIETKSSNYLIDTGSSYVVLTRKTQKKTNIGPITLMRVRLANGQTVSGEKYIIKELDLNGCLIKNIEGITFSQGDKDILGMSAIEKMMPITIDDKKKNIVFTCNNIRYVLKCRGCNRDWYL